MKRARSAVVLLLLTGAAVASTIAYVPLSLRQQFERADYAIHGRIARITHPGVFDRETSPMGPCGVHYQVVVLEQFKGDLPKTVWFASHKVLPGEGQFSVGEEVVVLLRDLTRLREQDPFRVELERIRATLQECHANASSLYAANYEDNLFQLLRKQNADGDGVWLEHSGQTLSTSDIGPQGVGRCRRQSDGDCYQFPAASWPVVRQALRSWAADKKTAG